MKRLIIVLVLTACLLVFVSYGCATSTKDEASEGEEEFFRKQLGLDSVGGGIYSESGESYAEPSRDDWDEGMITMPEEPPTVLITEPGLGQSWATERMIVRTGDIRLAVDDVADSIEQITVMANGLGGYVVSSRVWKEGERLVGRISIRVPAEQYNGAMTSLRNMAVDVTSESTTSQDVTEEYVDLSAQLQNLEATEEQLLNIMEKAETVDDILDVQRELSRTRGDIEQTRARMQYLEQTSSTSLIQVYLDQARLDVELRASRVTAETGEKIRFYNDVAGGFPPYSYHWDFGDAGISTETSPIRTYRSDGSYTVSLTVTDDRGNTDTRTRIDYITILPGWSVGSIAGNAWGGLVTFGQVLADVFIWIGIFSPVWLVIGGIGYWSYRRWFK